MTRIVFLFLLFASSAYSQTKSTSLTYFEEISPTRVGDTQSKRGNNSTTTQFDGFGQRFELNLFDNARLTKTLSLPSGMRLMKGELNGRPNSWARVTLVNDTYKGIIFDGQDLLAIDTNPDDPQQQILYRLQDVHIAPGSMSCGQTAVAPRASYDSLVQELEKQFSAPGATQEILVSAVADEAFVDDFGSNSESELLTRFNGVDGIFSEQLGIQITIDSVTLEGAGDGTFTTSDASNLLDELSDFRFSTPALRNTGLTHMYTGRNLSGNTVGVAFLGALCSSRFGAGLSQAGFGVMTDTLIAAHEIGHNFGAPHDGQSGSACEASTGRFLMSPSVNGSDEFSQCTLDEMAPEIASASCLTPLSAIDVSVVAQNGVSQAVGQSFNFQFTVLNNGTETASNVNFNVTIPSSVSVQSVNPSSGTCTQAAGGYACGLGAISAGGSASVVLSMSTNQSGSLELPATVSTDGDVNGANNDTTATITIEAAGDLSLNFASSITTVPLSTQRGIRLSVSNSGPNSQSNVSVDLNSGSTFSIQSIDGPGNCSVSTNTANCNVGTMNSGAAIELTINVLGEVLGNSALSATIAGDLTDPNTQNDSVSQTISVEPQASPNDVPGDDSGSGGGGMMGILSLFALCWLGRRRTRSLQQSL
ncbi:MAG: M12 family metallo-peptidase [Pseudomonadota bacterium]